MPRTRSRICLISLPFCCSVLQIVAENLYRQRALQAGLRLVDRVFRRLRIVERDARECREFLVDRRDQRRLVAIASRPFRVGLEADVELDVEKACRVGAVVGTAEFRGDRGHFGERAQYFADLRRDLRRFVERNRVGHRCAHPQRAFVELGHELCADARHEQQRCGQHNRRRERRAARILEADIEPAGVDRIDRLENRVAPLTHAIAHEPRAQHRQQHQRDDQRADQGEHHRVGHRLEQCAGRSRQHVDRQEADDDHGDRVEQRAVHFSRRLAHDLDDVEMAAFAQGDLAEYVFDHDDCAIDEDAEIDRADRKQIRRSALQVEADERE